MPIKLMKVMFVITSLIGLVACSSAETRYYLPSYYETSMVSNAQYQAGKGYFVDELRCRERQDKCMEGQSNDWVTHRTYRKQSFFE
ncbi:MAG: hypothetical protein HUJ13_04920 [Hydrogenovibrio crunogenus]|nr:hypothetical protein [Hydrogenovibrio crunogenus]